MNLLKQINKENNTAIVMVTHNRSIFDKFPGKVFHCKNEHCFAENEA